MYANLPATSIPHLGQTSSDESFSKGWLLLFAGLHLALIVPYSTNFVPWAYGERLFPIRPVLYMLGIGCTTLLLVLFKKPDLTRTLLAGLALVSARAIDAALLTRYEHPMGHDIWVFTLIASLFVYVVIAGSVGVLWKTSITPIIIASGATAFICSALIILESRGFGKYTIVEGRPAGWLGDPNNACIVITLMLGIFLTLNKRFWWNFGLLAFAAPAVALSLSRSGFLVYSLMLVVFVLMNLRQNFGKLMAAAIAVIPVAVLALSILAFGNSGGYKKDKNVEGRMSAIFSGDVNKMGSSERMKDLMDGVHLASKKPVLGHGVGAGASKVEPHNQIVSLWVDLGLLGTLLYVGLLIALTVKVLLAKLNGLLCLIPIVCYIPFSQILFEFEPYWYAVIILMFVTSKKFWSFSLFDPESSNSPS